MQPYYTIYPPFLSSGKASLFKIWPLLSQKSPILNLTCPIIYDTLLQLMFSGIRLLIVFLQLISNTIQPARAYADVSCQPIYGGGQTCVTTGNISINKTVMNPQTNAMVDNLSINDPKYQPGFIVTFQISITNTGNTNISRVQVDDNFPQYVTFSSGPGNFDSNTDSLTFEADNLAVNETRTYTILGRIVNASQIPISQGDVCVVNQATATDLDNTSQTSQANAQFCIEQTPAATSSGYPVLPASYVKTTPSTGPDSLALLALFPTGMLGFFLRKHSLGKERK